VVLDRLGGGRRGAVYSAYDPELNRAVAIKLLRIQGDRLLREAQALARLSHPNVIAVHDVGLHDGEQLFVAMELIQGSTVKQWLAEKPRTVSEVLEVFCQAGAGLAAAHAAGIVHGDLQPEDLIVGKNGRICVIGFGNANADANASASDDRRRFCEALGDGLSATGATVPAWLRAVIARGVGEAAPSMDALVAGLCADPAIARGRWLRVALGVVAAAALAIAGVTGGRVIRARRAAVLKTQLALGFGQEVEKISAIARYASLLPLHDTRRELDAIRARMGKLRERMRTLGPIADGPGHEALGRGYLALERFEDALRELEAAYATGYRSPELAYALGLVHGKLYQRALAEVQKTNDEKLDAARRAVIARAHRDPALRFLKEAGSREADGQLLVGVEAPEYVEGLIALYEERLDDALALARKTAARAFVYEARTLEGDIFLYAGQEHYWRGEIEASLTALGRAGEAYRAASEVARSGAAAYLGECQQLLETTKILVDRDESPEATVRRALAACAAAATSRSDDPAPLAVQARGWQQLAKFQEGHGVDPTAADEQTIRLAERALALDPRHVLAHIVIGQAYEGLGWHRHSKGGDARAVLQQAITHVERAVEIDPASIDAREHLGLAYNSLGLANDGRGVDPRPWYKAAIEHGQKALELSPGGFRAWNMLAESHWSMGQWEMNHGLDATQELSHAVEGYGKVAQISPGIDFGFSNLCGVHEDWASFKMRRDEDPEAELDLAIANCSRATELDKNYAGSHANLGIAYVERASWRLEHARDPTDVLAQAEVEFERALAIDPGYRLALHSLGQAYLLEARWRATRGRDPAAAFARVEAQARRAIAASDGEPIDSMVLLGELERYRAEWRRLHHLATLAGVQRGLSSLKRALEHNPNLAEAHALQGALELEGARAAATPSARAEAAERARAAIDRALGLNKNLAHDYQPLRDEAERLAKK
jgi:serine/threonine-protein kinase